MVLATSIQYSDIPIRISNFAKNIERGPYTAFTITCAKSFFRQKMTTFGPLVPIMGFIYAIILIFWTVYGSSTPSPTFGRYNWGFPDTIFGLTTRCFGRVRMHLPQYSLILGISIFLEFPFLVKFIAPLARRYRIWAFFVWPQDVRCGGCPECGNIGILSLILNFFLPAAVSY